MTTDISTDDDTSNEPLDRTDVGPTPWTPESAESPTAEENSSDRRRGEADPTDATTQRWKAVALRVKNQFQDDHVTLTGAGVAFFFFLALVPMLAAGVSIYGLVADQSDVTSLVDRLGPSVPEAVADLLRQQLSSVSTAAGGALGLGVAIGILSALWSASSGFSHLVEGLNIAYDEDESRGFVHKRVLALGLTLGFLVLVAAAIGVITFAAGVATGSAKGISLLAGWALVAVLFGVFLALLYRYGPNRDEPKWVWVSPGSIFAVIAWTAMTVGFGFYVSRFGSYNETYGSLGAIVVTLTWMYLTAVIVIIGAEITIALEHEIEEDLTADTSR